MIPQSQPRKKRNSSRTNLLVSFIVHAVLVLVLAYLAAREGLLGKHLKKITIEMVKEKPPPPKPKEPEKPKIEPPKAAPPKIVETPKPVEAPKAATPPPVAAPPTVAPPPAEIPSFAFEGGKAVESSSDPVQLYKGFIEYAFRSQWNRPENLNDADYVVQIAVSVDREGKIENTQWLSGSGNAQWDGTVRAAIAAVKSLDRPPPTNFPPQITIRFDTQPETEPALQ